MTVDSVFHKICILEDTPIKQAVLHLHEGHQRIILIINEQKQLQGVVSDSDIRHAILKGVSFDQPVHSIMIKNPIVATSDLSDDAILNLMRASHRYEIPIVDAENRVIGLKTIYNLVNNQKPAREAVIMAGGLGMRLRPLTDTVPKPLLMVGNKPILFIILDQLIQHDFTKITITLNYKGEMIKEAIKKVPHYKKIVTFVEEKEPLGTAGAISLLKSVPTQPFFVLNADLLTKTDIPAMLHHHEVGGHDITVAVKEETSQIPFGVIKLDGTQVLGVEEKPSQTFFINAGIYVLNPSLISEIPKHTFFTMTDLINKAVEKKKKVVSFPVYEYWLDIGAHDALNQANKTFSSNSND